MIEIRVDISRADILRGRLKIIQHDLDLFCRKPKKKKKPRWKGRRQTFKEILLESDIRREDGRKRNRTNHHVAPNPSGQAGRVENADGQDPGPIYRPGETDGI